MKNKLFNILILIFAVALFIGAFYMTSVLREREEKIRSESPITFCVRKDECFFTTHIHYHITLIENSRERTLPFELGPLERFHTHFEKNKVHWHAQIPVDPETKKFLETLTLADLIKDLNLPLDRAVIEIDGEIVDKPQNFVLDLRQEPHIKITLK